MLAFPRLKPSDHRNHHLFARTDAEVRPHRHTVTVHLPHPFRMGRVRRGRWHSLGDPSDRRMAVDTQSTRWLSAATALRITVPSGPAGGDRRSRLFTVAAPPSRPPSEARKSKRSLPWTTSTRSRRTRRATIHTVRTADGSRRSRYQSLSTTQPQHRSDERLNSVLLIKHKPEFKGEATQMARIACDPAESPSSPGSSPPRLCPRCLA